MKYLLGLSLCSSFILCGQNLAQVFPADYDQIQQLVDLKIPIYAQMGNSYVGVLTSHQMSLLDQNRLGYQTICPAPSWGEFYIVTPPEETNLDYASSVIVTYCQILLSYEGIFFVVAEPSKIEYLPRLRFHITHIKRSPIVLEQEFLPEIKSDTRYNAVVKWVIDQITPGELTRFLRDLSGENPVMVSGRSDTIYTRYSPTRKNAVALQYYYEKMQSSGVDSVVYHRFTGPNVTDSNVIAARIGRVYPRQQYLIGGHIDDISEVPNLRAPGADDNATGTVVGLICAKYIKGIPFKRTIKFVAWNCEERGGDGSDTYAHEASQRGDSIMGYLNGDMLGFEVSNLDSVQVYNAGRPGSIAITTKFTQVNTEYNIGLNIRVSTLAYPGSDHYFFWLHGYEAIFAIENDFNIYYHSTSDRVPPLDTFFYCKVVKCLVATLLELAEPDTIFPGVTEEKQLTIKSCKPISIQPNPALRNNLKIKFSVLQTTKVKLAIYNSLGQVEEVLVDGPTDAGVYEKVLNNRHRAGVYFVRFDDGKRTIVEKLVIIE